MATDSSQRTILSVSVDGGRYGFDVGDVLQVGNAPVATPVPGAPGFVAGITRFRGDVVPMIDLAARLGVEAGQGNRGRALYLGLRGRCTVVLVDGVHEILPLGAHEVDEAPGVLEATDLGMYRGVARVRDHLVAILDAEALGDFDVDRVNEVDGLDMSREGRPAQTESGDTPDAVHRSRFAIVRSHGTEYAIPAEAVHEVIPGVAAERTGRLPAYVDGLVSHRGVGIGVVDLHRRMNPSVRRSAEDPVASGCLVLLQVEDEYFALQVDDIVELTSFDERSIHPSPDMVSAGGEPIRALAVDVEHDRVVVVIAPERLVLSQHKKRLRKLGGKKKMNESQDRVSGSLTQYVLFQVGGIPLGLPIDEVLEVVRVPALTPVPFSPDHVLGVFQLRGTVVPVADIGVRLGIKGEAAEAERRLLLVRRGDQTVGLVAHGIEAIRGLEAGQVRPAPEIVHGVQGRFLKGVLALDEEKTALLLDLGPLMGANGGAE